MSPWLNPSILVCWRFRRAEIRLTITNNTTVQVAATGVGVATPVTIQATYIGSTQATIANQPVITQGSVQFALTVPAKETFPLVLTKGQVFTFTMTYTPTNSSGASAQVIIPYTEPSSSGGTATNSITLLFEGFAPSVSLGYFITPANGTTRTSSHCSRRHHHLPCHADQHDGNRRTANQQCRQWPRVHYRHHLPARDESVPNGRNAANSPDRSLYVVAQYGICRSDLLYNPTKVENR